MTIGLRLSVLCLLALLGAGCATPTPKEDISPGARPALDSDEAGFWMQMDQVEEALKTSGRVVTDPDLDVYVRDIVCRLAPAYCGDVRIYIVQSANFNASMAPNGSMRVWSGLILRAENEAQLAYVLGHELAHYLRRHSLRQWRDLRAKTDALVFFKFATAVAGVGIIGSIVELGTIESVFAFSRDQEREADERGFEMMAAAGYDPREAAKVWRRLLEEKEAAEDPDRVIFFSTHPSTEERTETLARLADARGGAGEVGREPFLAATQRFHRTWLRDELRQRDFPRMQVLLRQQEASGAAPGDVRFYEGELYRLRADEGDAVKAIGAYEAALQAGGAPAETHRSLALLYWSQGRKAEARGAFEAYLEANPDADDRAMVESYLQQI